MQLRSHESSSSKTFGNNNRPRNYFTTQMHRQNESSHSDASKLDYCYFYQKGACRKGEGCPFQHVISPTNRSNESEHHSNEGKRGLWKEKAYSKTPCFYFQKGQCVRGQSCAFSHNFPEHVKYASYIKGTTDIQSGANPHIAIRESSIRAENTASQLKTNISVTNEQEAPKNISEHGSDPNHQDQAHPLQHNSWSQNVQTSQHQPQKNPLQPAVVSYQTMTSSIQQQQTCLPKSTFNKELPQTPYQTQNELSSEAFTDQQLAPQYQHFQNQCKPGHILSETQSSWQHAPWGHHQQQPEINPLQPEIASHKKTAPSLQQNPFLPQSLPNEVVPKIPLQTHNQLSSEAFKHQRQAPQTNCLQNQCTPAQLPPETQSFLLPVPSDQKQQSSQPYSIAGYPPSKAFSSQQQKQESFLNQSMPAPGAFLNQQQLSWSTNQQSFQPAGALASHRQQSQRREDGKSFQQQSHQQLHTDQSFYQKGFNIASSQTIGQAKAQPARVQSRQGYPSQSSGRSSQPLSSQWSTTSAEMTYVPKQHESPLPSSNYRPAAVPNTTNLQQVEKKDSKSDTQVDMQDDNSGWVRHL